MDRRPLLDHFMEPIAARNAYEPEFLQAVEAVAAHVLTVEKAHADYTRTKVLEKLTEPDRLLQFRVVWEDDAGRTRINRGWRVQMSNAIGPYKGGIRFQRSVTPSVLKFLAFEQCFKNALTGKGPAFGGSVLRTEATGYGLAYFVECTLAQRGASLEGRRVTISGKGNVSTHAADKAINRRARVITLSDTSGTLHAPDGFTREMVAWVRERKAANEEDEPERPRPLPRRRQG